jgi:CheY-like chemotaxis protein
MESGSGTRIVLVVEDDMMTRMDVVDALRDDGWGVLEAASGEGAVAYLKAGEHIDLVITDIQLAGEMNGWDVADAFRAASSAMPIIYVSGAARQLPRELPGSKAFAKPYSNADLLAACHELVAA